jgi:hypothetical protein
VNSWWLYTTYHPTSPLNHSKTSCFPIFSPKSDHWGSS